MQALIIILPVYFILFIFYGTRDLRRFLLLTGIVTIPFQTTYSLYFVGVRDGTSGIILTLSDISFIALFLDVIIRESSFKITSTIIKPALLFIFACIFSLLNSVSGTLTMLHIFLFSKLLFLYYLVFTNAIQSENDIKFVLRCLIISVIFQGIVANIQYFGGYNLDLFRTGHHISRLMVLDAARNVVRARGTTPHPNGFAAYLVPIILLNLSAIFSEVPGKKIKFVAILVGIVTLLETCSRGGWLSFIVSFGIYIIIGLKWKFLNYGKLFIIILIMGLLYAGFSGTINERIFGYDANSAMSRISLMKLAFNMVKEHPIVGIGANTFYNQKYLYISDDIAGQYIDLVHNEYLLVWAETGIIGLCGFLGLIFSFLKEGSYLIRQNENKFLKYIGLGIGLGLFSNAIFMNTDVFGGVQGLGSFFIFLGVLSVGRRIIASESNDSEKED